MDYTKIYFRLTSNKQLRRKGKGVYYEKHHIIPKSMGGSNEHSNLCLLTSKEHFLAHRLLVKIYPNDKRMQYALFCMAARRPVSGRIINSRQYEIARRFMVQLASEKKGILNPFFKKKHSEEFKEEQRRKGRLRTGSKNANFGNKWTQKQKDVISKLNKGRLLGDKNPAKHPSARKKLSEGKLGSKNPRAQEWPLENKLTGELITVNGGINRFLKQYPGSSLFKVKSRTDPNFNLHQPR
jgi:hypothetical protein